jgi:aromatic ring-opening dioxygenase LigB subunit
MIAKGKAGEAEEAIVIGLEGANTVQDENLRGTLLASKAQARAAAKDWEGARAVVEEITSAQQRTAALVDIAFCATENGRAQLALSWGTTEASPLSEARVLVSVAEALLHQPHQIQQMFFVR